jgi:putative transposase
MNRRKSLRLPEYDYSIPGEYFITICVHERHPCLSNIIDANVQLTDVGIIAKNWIDQTCQKFKTVHINNFIIMPDHVHMIVEISEDPRAIRESPLQQKMPDRRVMLLSKIIGFYKMNSAKEINKILKTRTRFWQRNYYERVIRDAKEYHEMAQYIFDNPARWDNS